MITNALIIYVRQEGQKLCLKLRPEATPGKLTEMIIIDFTHRPRIGQSIWGTENLVFIEVGMGISERHYYIPNQTHYLIEKSDNTPLVF